MRDTRFNATFLADDEHAERLINVVSDNFLSQASAKALRESGRWRFVFRVSVEPWTGGIPAPELRVEGS